MRSALNSSSIPICPPLAHFESPRIYSQRLAQLQYLDTNVRLKLIATLEYYFNAQSRFSNFVSACKKHSATPPKIVQPLTTARAKLAQQWWSSVQDFCVGLADPNVHVFASSGAQLLLASSLPLTISCAVKNFRRGSSDHRHCQSLYCFSLTAANVC